MAMVSLVGSSLGVLLGGLLAVVGGGDVGFLSPSCGCTRITMMIATSATASSDTIAMSGHIHGLRRRVSGIGVVVDPGAADGMTRVAAGDADSSATAPAATPGTPAAGPAMWARRSGCAAGARRAADAGRSWGRFAMHEYTRFRTGSDTVTGRSGGASLICAIAIATCDSPVKGRRPARASYATMPSE